ncbi:exosortase A [Paucibacter sp. M5-1]|uniref:exosortase A n=1 Tax=Paucibacter sp. M5-1 TaxID=3015998 RepID=UPI0022B935A1|nr:exosortase A [Paucibacter sp. M5-1]MCZ7884881.1 exosortase A [Paucibacter sp. M5-1]
MSSVAPQLSAPSLPQAWRVALPLFALLLLLLLLLFRETGLAMVGIWQRSDTFAHAFVVPPISLWLIWRQREALARLGPQPSFWFAIPFLAAALAWLLGDLVAVNALTQLALVAMLVLSVPLVLGHRVAWQIAFPLAFLFFAVPIGEFMMPALMEATADFTVAALRASGVPVYREGLQFVIPSGNWSVVEACSGLRYLMASGMVGTLFAYLNYNSLRRRLVFIAFAFALPLLANWLRAYIIVMLGHLSDNAIATGADHLVYGWVFFGIIMLAMFMIGARWAEPLESVALPTVPARPGSQAVWVGALLALLIALLPLSALTLLPGGSAGRAPALTAPQLQAWAENQTGLPDWTPIYRKPAAELQAAYIGQAQQPVGLHIAYYRGQTYDSKLVSSLNQLVRSEDKQWTRMGSQGQALSLDGQDLRLRGTELRSAGTRLLVWQFYWIDGRLTASDVRAKLYGAWQRLSGRGDDAAAVIVYTVKDTDNAASAQALLQNFLQQNWGAIEAQLQQAKKDAAR